ncbi:MAG: Hpt domain-containing protein, partial [Shimia sp.]
MPEGEPQADLRGGFFEECSELFEGVYDVLETASASGRLSSAQVDAVFRAVHTIKGGAGIFDMSRVVDTAHDLETRLSALRGHESLPLPDWLVDSLDLLSQAVQTERV